MLDLIKVDLELLQLKNYPDLLLSAVFYKIQNQKCISIKGKSPALFCLHSLPHDNIF